MTSDELRPSALAYPIATAVLLLFAAGAVTLVWLAPGSTPAKVKLVITLIGLYGLAIGFFPKTSAFPDIAPFIKGLTSTDVGLYIVTNFRFAALLPLTAATALTPHAPTKVTLHSSSWAGSCGFRAASCLRSTRSCICSSLHHWLTRPGSWRMPSFQRSTRAA